MSLRLEAVYGDGIENYMNDATVDVAPQLSLARHWESKASRCQSWEWSPSSITTGTRSSAQLEAIQR